MDCSPLESSDVPSSGPSAPMSVELSCLSPELVGSPVVASVDSSVDSLANVLDPSSLPSEVVGPSVVVSASSEDSLASVPSVPPDTGVREPSSELVSEVAMASDSSEDSLANVSECLSPEFVAPVPPGIVLLVDLFL